jgi:hypothetical protein
MQERQCHCQIQHHHPRRDEAAIEDDAIIATEVVNTGVAIKEAIHTVVGGLKDASRR